MKQRKTHKDFLADFKKNNLKSDKIEILGKYETYKGFIFSYI